MRILFNCLNLNKGGAERVISVLSNSFAKDNEVAIITNMFSNLEYDFDTNIMIESLVEKKQSMFFRKIRRLSPILLLKLKNKILKFKPDIIISFLPEPNFRILFLKKHFKSIKDIPVIISVRNDPNTEYKNKIINYIMKKLYSFSNQMILQTDDAKKYFEKNIGFFGKVIHNPVDKQFLEEKYEGIREKKIVAVGRLEKQKNYVNMINAFELFLNTYDDYILEIYGDGKLKKDLQNYIIEKKLENKILLKGKVNDIKSRIYKASLFVMSSNYEGMPNSLLEAACLGVPCISTDCPCGGPKEILENGRCGILVPVNDYKKLADGMIKMISDSGLGKTFSENSSKNSKKYSVERIVDEWKQEIYKILKEDGRHE